MPHKMSDSEYLSIVNSYEASAKENNCDINVKNTELQRRYRGDPYGDELPERSKIVSNDVQDVVEADMPSLARNFLGAGKICIFEPNSEDEKDIDEAREKTEYIDWIVRGQMDSFRINHGFLKDIEINKMGALKYIVEDIVEKETVTHEDISFEELAKIQEDIENDETKKFEVTEREEITGDDEEQTIKSVTFEITTNKRKAKLLGVPLETLLISPNAKDEEDATLVGDMETKTRGDLLQEGIEIKVIASLPTRGTQDRCTDLKQVRFNDQGGIQEDDFGDWANEEVDISDLYVKIDKDGDGVAERRHIVKSGDIILEDEPFAIVPYSITSAILMSHSAIGRSRAEITAPTAKIKTALVRGIADNSYAHNAPQVGVNDNVNYDDLLTKRPNGIVRVKGNENPGNSLFPINVDYIGDKALQVVQYFDMARAQTTGANQANQGLQADSFGQETAARFNGVQDSGEAKVELVARVIAETGYKRAYEGIAWLVSQYQTTKDEIMVLGKPLTVDPTKWRSKHSARSTIGLGAGDGERTSETLSSIYQVQTQLATVQSPLVDQLKIYNTLDNLLKSVDIHNTSEFFNNPERPEQLVNAENELLRGQVQQAQQIIEQLQSQDILSKAEIIKAESKSKTDNKKAALDIAKLREDARQFDVSTDQGDRENKAKVALELTKIEATTGKNVPGSRI